MRDYLTLGPTPAEEKCIGLGPNYDHAKALKESRVYKRQLERAFPDAPEGCYFTVKSFPHEYGNYLEVVVSFDNDDEEQTDFAYDVERSLPGKWDDIAKIHLLPKFQEVMADLPKDLADGPTSRY
jgi:hypothetical protein